MVLLSHHQTVAVMKVERKVSIDHHLDEDGKHTKNFAKRKRRRIMVVACLPAQPASRPLMSRSVGAAALNENKKDG